MKQEIFTDIEYSYRKKKTKREEFLEIMDEIENPWNNGFFIQIAFIKCKNWHIYCLGTE